jgi:hypothetical protein
MIKTLLIHLDCDYLRQNTYSMTNEPTYHYDQIYPYPKILQEVKELIVSTIIDMANPTDYQHTGLNKEAYADIIYTHVMALGYNNGDLKAALDDIFPSRNPFFYPETDDSDAAAKMLFTLARIQKRFKHQAWAFEGFHRDTQQLKPRKEVISEVKKQLLASSFDPEV